MASEIARKIANRFVPEDEEDWDRLARIVDEELAKSVATPLKQIRDQQSINDRQVRELVLAARACSDGLREWNGREVRAARRVVDKALEPFEGISYNCSSTTPSWKWFTGTGVGSLETKR